MQNNLQQEEVRDVLYPAREIAKASQEAERQRKWEEEQRQYEEIRRLRQSFNSSTALPKPGSSTFSTNLPKPPSVASQMPIPTANSQQGNLSSPNDNYSTTYSQNFDGSVYPPNHNGSQYSSLQFPQHNSNDNNLSFMQSPQNNSSLSNFDSPNLGSYSSQTVNQIPQAYNNNNSQDSPYNSPSLNRNDSNLSFNSNSPISYQESQLNNNIPSSIQNNSMSSANDLNERIKRLSSVPDFNSYQQTMQNSSDYNSQFSTNGSNQDFPPTYSQSHFDEPFNQQQREFDSNNSLSSSTPNIKPLYQDFNKGKDDDIMTSEEWDLICQNSEKRDTKPYPGRDQYMHYGERMAYSRNKGYKKKAAKILVPIATTSGGVVAGALGGGAIGAAVTGGVGAPVGMVIGAVVGGSAGASVGIAATSGSKFNNKKSIVKSNNKCGSCRITLDCFVDPPIVCPACQRVFCSNCVTRGSNSDKLYCELCSGTVETRSFSRITY